MVWWKFRAHDGARRRRAIAGRGKGGFSRAQPVARAFATRRCSASAPPACAADALAAPHAGSAGFQPAPSRGLRPRAGWKPALPAYSWSPGRGAGLSASPPSGARRVPEGRRLVPGGAGGAGHLGLRGQGGAGAGSAGVSPAPADAVRGVRGKKMTRSLSETGHQPGPGEGATVRHLLPGDVRPMAQPVSRIPSPKPHPHPSPGFRKDGRAWRRSRCAGRPGWRDAEHGSWSTGATVARRLTPGYCG